MKKGTQKRHCSIQFSDDTVTKIASPERMRIEVEKSRRAFEIGQACGLFYVPRVLDYDEDKGMVVFEKLNIRPIFHAVKWGCEYNIMGERLGRCLAVIHKELELPDEMKIALLPEISLPGDYVCLHGDFGTFNIFLENNSSKIVIIDWQTSILVGGEATYGTRYFDLMWFINNIIYRPTIRQWRFFCGDCVTPVVKRFLGAYSQESGMSFDRNKFVVLAQKFKEILLPIVKENSSFRRRVLMQRSYVLRKKVMSLFLTKQLN